MTLLEQKISSGKTVVTAELTPPKGTDLTELLAKADALRPYVDAINLTESARARLTVDPRAVARLFLDRGIEPIVQVTARDRNRIAIQADLLGAAVLGIGNLVFMRGDSPTGGDHPEAKAVFDLTATEMLQAARGLMEGHDLAGNELRGAPRFFLGAVANPGAPDLATEVDNARRKIDAGARFLQTQAVYEAHALQRFLDALEPNGVAILAGIIPLKSATMARWLNRSVPGIRVPDELLERLDRVAGSDQELVTGIEIAAQTIREVSPLCAGVHLMALGWEKHIPAILEAALHR
ncbi:MAG TPA: methylenetetrahydrofolate reductase [Steroidobacteraceae bacterium]